MRKIVVVVPFIVIGLLCFSSYAYKVRNVHNTDEQDKHVGDHHYQVDVLSHALSLLPDKEKSEVYFKSIESKYPDFKEDKDLCDMLGYKEPDKDKKEAEPVVEVVKESYIKEDTTIVEVMNYLIG